MKLKTFVLAFGTATLLVPAISAAQRPKTPNDIWLDSSIYGGAGLASCGSWLEESRGKDLSLYYMYAGWVQGYVTAGGQYLGMQLGRPARKTDSSGITAFMDKYCTDNPTEAVTTAAAELVATLFKK